RFVQEACCVLDCFEQFHSGTVIHVVARVRVCCGHVGSPPCVPPFYLRSNARVKDFVRFVSICVRTSGQSHTHETRLSEPSHGALFHTHDQAGWVKVKTPSQRRTWPSSFMEIGALNERKCRCLPRIPAEVLKV
ncbi:hypothetical protein HMPREF0183_0283, partial [Brevibacterium mcbrellneri ATCC 49030]